MKALLIKDYYVAKKYLRSYVIMLVVFLFVGAVNGNAWYFLGFPCILSGILTVSLFSYDERFRWDCYCELLPISRRTVISEKYVLTLIISLSVCLLSAVIEAIHVPFTSPEYLLMVVGRTAMTLMVPVIMLPIVVKLGVEKARVAYYIVIGFFTAMVAMIFTQSVSDLSSSVSAGSASPAIALITVLIIAALYAGSWLLSIKLYEAKEL